MHCACTLSARRVPLSPQFEYLAQSMSWATFSPPHQAPELSGCEQTVRWRTPAARSPAGATLSREPWLAELATQGRSHRRAMVRRANNHTRNPVAATPWHPGLRPARHAAPFVWGRESTAQAPRAKGRAGETSAAALQRQGSRRRQRNSAPCSSQPSAACRAVQLKVGSPARLRHAASRSRPCASRVASAYCTVLSITRA